MSLGRELPAYPWDTIAEYREQASQHPEGLIDLSIGTPVDPTPEIIQDALQRAANAPGYPSTHGTQELREAIAGWFQRRRGVSGLAPEAVMPTVGSKELVAWLPTLLGLGPADIVLRPEVSYPTYEIGTILSGARSLPGDELDAVAPQSLKQIKLIWVNSPANPNGVVRDTAQLRAIVEQARERGIVVASDECYAELGWGEWDVHRGGQRVPSILDPEVCGDSHEGLLAVYSLSKQSNLAGYRAAFIAGDQRLVANLVNTRKHAGMIVPAPVQAAMVAALSDDQHVSEQKDRYRARRELLLSAVERLGLRVEGSQAGLYLWLTQAESATEDTWKMLRFFAERGILVGPGTFYGDAGAGYVRVALTATDPEIAAAVQRLG